MFTYPVGLLSSKIQIPRDGLIGEWLFDGNANDTSGNGNNGTVSGATLTTDRDGVSNSAYDFTASNTDIITFGDPVELRDIASSDFTISAWLRNNTSALATFWSSGSTTKGILIRSAIPVTNTRIQINIQYSTTDVFYRTVEVVPVNTWFHLAITFDSTTKVARIYLDNVEPSYETSQAGSGTLVSDSGETKEIGMLTPSSSLQSWTGLVDSVRIYNRILTASEITALYNE